MPRQWVSGFPTFLVGHFARLKLNKFVVSIRQYRLTSEVASYISSTNSPKCTYNFHSQQICLALLMKMSFQNIYDKNKRYGRE